MAPRDRLPLADQRNTPLRVALVATPLLVTAASAMAQSRMGTSPAMSRPVVLLIALAALALVPFLLMMVTSFVKIAVVLSIIRSALGTQQIPPTQVIIGLAIVLTIHIMVPVGLDVYRSANEIAQKRTGEIFSDESVSLLTQAARAGKEPMIDFLYRHSHRKERNLFVSLAQRMRKLEDARKVTDRDLTVLVPAFVISELKEAFQIGFLLFVPFVVIDMVVANILLAMGMFMLSPTMISLPFKLLLFVLVDGWYLIAKGLVISYA
jgi:type III secretion protein R